MKEQTSSRHGRYQELKPLQQQAALQALTSFMVHFNYQQYMEDLLTVVWRFHETDSQDVFPETLFKHWAETRHLVSTCQKIIHDDDESA